MNRRQKHLSQVFTFLCAVLTIVSSTSGTLDIDRNSSLAASISRPLNLRKHSTPVSGDTMNARIAERLKNRLNNRGIKTPDGESVESAVKQRQQLLKKNTTVRVLNPKGEVLQDWEIALAAYPTWIEGKFSATEASFTLSKDQIRNYLEREPLVGVSEVVHANVLSLRPLKDTESGYRAETDAIAKSGLSVDSNQAAELIHIALNENYLVSSLQLENQEGGMTYKNADGSVMELSLIATGKSNFKGSGMGRIRNVRKAIHDHVHNTVIESGQIYSFNNALEGSVSLGNGWSMAKVIFNGTTLEDAPGGGICQASTTVYRAILNAGLPVLKRKSHSLYVTYYKMYGVGIDATVFPGAQDLTFLNDTAGPIVIQAYENEEFELTVNFYGIPDGRKMALEGPYFSSTAPENLLIDGRAVKGNEIVWLQTITKADGAVTTNVVTSRYLNMPRSLASEFPIVKEGETLAQN